MNHVRLPVSFVYRAIWPYLFADALFESFDKLTFKLTLIFTPLLDSMTILQIISPLSFICASINCTCVFSEATGLVSNPLPLISVSDSVNEVAVSLCSPIHPVTLVRSSIWPSHQSKAVSKSSTHLTFIDRAIAISENLWLLLWKAVYIIC